ncbi:MAG: M23 family metallopeptidase [Clostridia bacterium]|nr:M23 family metallopeptidase [Clostridia bacterium]
MEGKKIEGLKKLVIIIRSSTKLIILLTIAIIIILGVIFFVYNPMYSVTLSGKFIGYTKDKREFQKKITNYIKSGDGKEIAFVDIETLPEYKLCLLKKGIEPNEEEIFNIVVDTGIAYYKYYAILENNVEKKYVKTYEEAESVVSGLQEKDSMNKDNISYLLKYETELKEFAVAEDIVNELYKQKPVVKTNQKINTMKTVDYSKTPISIALIEPIQGTITSRFGSRSRGIHTGLDVATSLGTPVKAAASGVVTYAGYKGSYGYLVVIDHGDGVQTYYAHCSKLYVNAGDSVSQGQVISAVGNTGNSTGPHLHIEVRVNGVAKNPQNYLYN